MRYLLERAQFAYRLSVAFIWGTRPKRDGERVAGHSCSIPMGRAMWCCDCDQICRVASRCATCGSTACMMLANTLVDRPRRAM
jgi:hypothetical protein